MTLLPHMKAVTARCLKTLDIKVVAGFFFLFIFLSLLCATAQQNYCHDVGVRRPSVDIVFSETVNWIDIKFY